MRVRHEWRDYLDILAKAGGLPALTWMPDDEQLRAEVHQQIAMNLVQGYFYYFQSDPDFPDFAPFFNSVLRLQPNPDDVYYLARLDGAGCYRVSGERGTVHLLTFTTAHDFIGTSDTPGRQDGECNADNMEIEADGRFQLLISVERPASYSGNWLRMAPTSNYLLVRMRSYAWGEERDARLAIERIDGSPRQNRLDAGEIDKRLRDLMVYAERASRQWYLYQNALRDRGYVNKLELTRFEDLGGGKLQTYWQGVFDLQDGEALLLETAIPDNVRYWNVQLNDQLFNTLEYYYCQSSLNGHQARLDDDGKFRAVIASEDPAIPNWLDTVGRRQGTIIGRWFGGDSVPTPTLTKVPLRSIREKLAGTTPIVNAASRASALRARVRGGQMRRRW